MAKNNNLQDYLKDIANAIREKKGTVDTINAQDFSTEIENLPSGGGTTVKGLLDAIKKTSSLFETYVGYNVDDLIAYNDTENVIYMGKMFYKSSNLITIPLLNTSKVTNMSAMFYECSSLTSIPLLNTSKVTNVQSMFAGCYKLTAIPALDFSNVTAMESVFYNCQELKEIQITGMKVNFSISYSTKLAREALVEILNNLATVTTTRTLTMGATNLAKLTDEDKLIATNKGWTLA